MTTAGYVYILVNQIMSITSAAPNHAEMMGFLNKHSSSLQAVLNCMLVAAVLSNGCATNVNKQLVLSEEQYYFELSEPLPVKDAFLPSGSYRCYYKDEKGCYFEAPATLKVNMLFSRGRTGGVYVIRSSPIQAFVYSQDKHPGSTYVYGIGSITYGGSGYYVVGDPLPDSVVSSIHIQKEDSE
ncbi:MAG: hypothetical protein ACR2RB_20270 [Gammaproteobacteria bacterium]